MATDMDYHDILDMLPLPEKYLICKPNRGSQGSTGSEDSCSRELPLSASGKTSRGSWGSAEADLNILSKSPDGAHTVDRQTKDPLERRSEERFRDTTDPLSSGMFDVRVRSLGSTPVMERKRRLGNSLYKPLSTENILAKVKELLGDQTARAKVTDIVEAQKAECRRKDTSKHVAAIPATKVSHGTPSEVEREMAVADERPGYRKVVQTPTTKGLSTGAEPGNRSRRAVKNTADIKLFNPKLTRLRDGRTLDKSNTDPTEDQFSDGTQGIGSLGFSNSRSGDSVPTAHVSPSPLIQSHDSSRHSAAITKYPSTENLRVNHSKQSSLPARLTPDPAGLDSQLLPPDAGHGWSNHHNISKEAREEFRVIPPDPNVTQDQTAYLHEGEPPDAYRKGGVHVGARHTYDVSKANKHDLIQEGSVHLDPNNVHSYNYSGYGREGYRSGPHSVRGTSPVLGHTSATSDRGYGYTQGRAVAQPMYSPQSYTSSDSYQGYGTTPGPPVAPHVMGSDAFTSDFNSWQQKHQEALRRQQIEASQPVMAQDQYTHSSHSASAASNLLLGDPHKLDAVKRAADNIIKEKDMIIDRQKSKIVDLERHTKESEIDRQRELLRRAKEDSENLGVKFQDMYMDDYLQPQELQYENSDLKAQLAECFALKRNDQNEIEKKLGASEYELQQLKQRMEKEIMAKSDEVAVITDKMKDKDLLLLEWKDKFTEEKRQKEELQKRVDSMARYFNDLPTAEEHTKRTEEVKGLRDDKARYKQRISDLEKKVADLHKGHKSRDGLIESLEHNEVKLKSRLDKFEVENIRLRERLTQDGIPLDDIEELQHENQRLMSDLAKAKKLLETQHKRQQQIEARHKSELSQLEERLEQEESAVTALREEVASKDQNLVKLRQSVKELGSQNQDLMSEGMSLQDRVKEMERQLTGDIHKLEARLMRELTVCFSELQNLVQICVQHAEGQDPNMSALLGVKASAVSEPEPEGDSKDVASLKFKVSKVRDMRNEIDKLRELISNKYAEDMGDNLNCITQ